MTKDDMLTTQELADLMHTSLATVYQWNCEGVGPKRLKVGKRVLYRRRDVEAWLETRAVA